MLRPATHLADQDGSVLVIVAVAMTSLVLIAAFVIDVANFYSHKRHLQVQADAAALAGAHNLTAAGCSNSLIDSGARAYGGSDSPDGTLIRTQAYNDQLGGTPAKKVHILVNSTTYWDGADTSWNSGDPKADGAPCGTGYVDIKATESNLPWFFGFGGFVKSINAHARVSLFEQSTANGTLPIAVPNPLPTSAAAIFINEATKAVLATQPFTHVGPSGTLDMWQTSAGSVTLPGTATGVVIAMSGRQTLQLSGLTLAEICSQQLTDCYDSSADPPNIGLSFIRGYSASGSGTQPNKPILRSVELIGATCSPYFAKGTCIYDVVARIDAGTALPKANQIYGANGVTLDSSTNSNCGYVVGPDQCWHGTLTLPAGSGPQNIEITWEETSGQVQMNKLEDCKVGNGNKCNGTFGMSQRAYGARDISSGPIELLKVFNCDGDPSCTLSDRQSYETGSSHTFMVAMGIAGTLRNATSVLEPDVQLRVKSNTGQSLDCDDQYTNLKQELAYGCGPSYTPNTGTPDCSTLGTNAARALAQPWSCIAVNTGMSPNDVAAGLNNRLFGDEKPPNGACKGLGTLGYNNWSMFVENYVPTGPGDPRGQDGFPVGDPRVLNAYLTTYGAFSHVNGTSGSVPVTGFGHFYVTGYTGANGGGFKPPCQGNGDAPVPNDASGNPDSGLIVGHFIRFVDTIGGDGSLPCNPASINACVIVMTN
jgi:Putative Flp pilus-assembly TadE/G-like